MRPTFLRSRHKFLWIERRAVTGAAPDTNKEQSMSQQYRRVERSIEEVINDYLAERQTILYSNFTPNIGIAKAAIEANEIDEEHHRWRGDVIRDVVRKVAGRRYSKEEG